MSIENIAEKFAIIISSCDKYSDLWEPFFNLFWKNWKDCPFKIYLITNNLDYNHPKVNLLKIGEDKGWSENLKKGLALIKEDYIFMIIEDHFLINQVDSKNILSLAIRMYQNNYNYLRLNPSLKPDIKIDLYIGKINQDSIYRTSIPFSFWNKNTLVDLLNDDETAWDFEIKGSERSSKYDNFFATRYHSFKFIHGVKRGIWYRNAIKQLGRMNILIDTKNRNIMRKSTYIKNRIIDYIHFILMKFFPNKIKTIIMNKVYKNR